MARLKKEEVIQLYKIPNSMDAKEICRYSGFFTSVAVINKYLNEARALGIITPEDDNVFKKRQNEKEEETMHSLAIKRGIFTKERYEEIIQQIRTNSIRETNKKKKQMKLEKEQNR